MSNAEIHRMLEKGVQIITSKDNAMDFANYISGKMDVRLTAVGDSSMRIERAAHD